jgi:hypothetical protein
MSWFIHGATLHANGLSSVLGFEAKVQVYNSARWYGSFGTLGKYLAKTKER